MLLSLCILVSMALTFLFLFIPPWLYLFFFLKNASSSGCPFRICISGWGGGAVSISEETLSPQPKILNLSTFSYRNSFKPDYFQSHWPSSRHIIFPLDLHGSLLIGLLHSTLLHQSYLLLSCQNISLRQSLPNFIFFF